LSSRNKYSFIFAAGGTGGHLYPAIAVAEQLKLIKPEADILFVGTRKKIEARVIPLLGYKFKTIWISGFSRKMNLKNLLFPLKFLAGSLQSFFINLNFNPKVAIGAGAYVSGPIIWFAKLFGSKIVLLEQNSFPGVTNRLLEKKADEIHISFEDSRKYFKEQTKLKLSGNPIRPTMKLADKNSSLESFGLQKNKKTLFVVGGSLGSASINKAIKENLNSFINSGIQIIWQTGELYFDAYKNLANDDVKIFPFITNVEFAYSASNLVIARSGATTIAEVSFLGLPVLFVPSSNVAANHQYKNAKSLYDNKAALLLEDSELESKLFNMVLNSINDEILLNTLKNNIKKYSRPDAANIIARDIIKLAES
jgi:UDP-N-acetylglucosamine--N-acetylmuramyl-(pentapeptide) pyrophosphoryl-undecaprenol N-acetylglucosamine transferase